MFGLSYCAVHKLKLVHGTLRSVSTLGFSREKALSACATEVAGALLF